MRNGESFTERDLDTAEQIIGYRFKDRELLKASFTHKSYSNVNGGEDNERLEFLGDAVLQLCVTEELYFQNRGDEGALTGLRQRFVSQTALEQATARANLMQFLRYSGGEHNVGGKTASNLFEAVIGAIYLDGGKKPVRQFLKKYLQLTVVKNYKTLLQEYAQERTKKTPAYSVEEKEGKFIATVYAMERTAQGVGESKKIAETKAAEELYQILLKESKH